MKKRCFVWISSFSGCLKNRGCIVDRQGSDPAHSLVRVLYLAVVSGDEERILTCSHKDDFLIVTSLHGSSRGGRKRGQRVCPNVTRAKWGERQLGAPLGLLPIGWVILVLSGRNSTSVSGPGWGQQPLPAGGHAPAASDCSVEVVQGFLFQELISMGCRLPHFTSTNPTGLFKPTLLLYQSFLLHIWNKDLS